MATEQVAAELKRLERDNGRLLPDDVIETARDPDNPLYSYFEWDDAICGRDHRREQARKLIRSVKLEITVQETTLRVVNYVRDPLESLQAAGYRNILNVREEEDTSRAVIIDEMKRVVNTVQRAKSVAAVLGVAADLDQIARLASSIIGRARDVPGPDTPQ